MAEFKSYDTQDTTTIHNARLAKDAQVFAGGDKPMVKLTTVITNRGERYSDLWLEVTVQDRNSDLAAFLKKGDVVGITGKLAMRKWGDSGDKVSIELVRAEVHPPIELFGQLKERGFTPGAGKVAAKPVATKPKFAPKAKKIVDLDDDLPSE